MKKSIFALFACIAICFVGFSVFATDVGKHPPKMHEQSIVCDMQADLVAVYTVEPLSAPVVAVTVAKVRESIERPVVSMPRGDAAIPIRAQASYSVKYHKNKYYKLPDAIMVHNFAVDRYWC